MIEHVFKLLNMSSSTELSTRARILAAAIARYATDGLGASLRSIASDAGVSAGLIIHHFGSADELRAACDREVLAMTRQAKIEVVADAGAVTAMFTQLAHLEDYAPAIGYLLRRLQTGGTVTAVFVDQFVADAVDYLAEGERAGAIRPSRDPQARARLLVEQALGALLLQLPAQQETLDLTQLPIWLRQYTERTIVPALEQLTEPLLTDSTLLDAYLELPTADD